MHRNNLIHSVRDGLVYGNGWDCSDSINSQDGYVQALAYFNQHMWMNKDIYNFKLYHSSSADGINPLKVLEIVLIPISSDVMM